ncbi:MAG: hypothetical protein V1871_08795 [Planctomycetota bacterium]
MKRILLTGYLLITLLICSVILPGDLPSAENNNNPQARAKVGDLRHEISLINLVNGLNFNEKQLDQLITIIKETISLREVYQEKINALSVEEAGECTKVREILIERGPNIDPQEGKKAGELKEKIEEVQEELQTKLTEFQTKTEVILTEAQKEVVGTFKNCLIPIPSLRNPVRVGQTASNEKEIKALRQLRSIPQKAYDKKRSQILEKQFKHFEEKYGKLTEEEKAKEEARLFGLVDEVRAMSAEEFELNKEEVAAQYKIKNKAEELSEQLKELKEYRTSDKPKLNKIGHYFLDPTMLGVLETRLKNLKNFKAPAPANLDNIGNKAGQSEK